MPKFVRARWFLLQLLSLLCAANAPGAEPFRDQIQPFLKTYCYECHNEKTTEGELNLTKYASAALLAEDFRQWEHVATFAKSGEMPPEKAKQPTAQERDAFLRAVRQVMLAEAHKLAGDPGDVLPRRLSNAEYNYTIRDLTGVDMRPADAFPIDPASGEGFSNTGEALSMSPSLFRKYYAAAQLVADHVDFTPTTWSFAPYPVATYADQKKLHEQAILDFYSRHDVQYDAYLTSAWKYRHRSPERTSATIDQWATESKLSPKYLRALWEVLEGKTAQDVFYVRWLRKRWQVVPVEARDAEPELRKLAKEVGQLGKLLCPPETAAIVSHAGNGPIQHIDRRNQTAAARGTFNKQLLTDSRRFHVELRDLAKQDTVRLVFQVTSDEEDGTEEAHVILKDLNFSTSNPDSYKPRDAQHNFALRDILEKHAPQQLAKLHFGQHPLGHTIDPQQIAIGNMSLIELEIPTSAFPNQRNLYLYVDAQLDREHSPAGLARFRLFDHKPTDDSLVAVPFPLVNPEHKRADTLRQSCESLCQVFPNRFCYVDETRGLSAGFHLIEGFFRDDQPLCQHVLSDAEKHELDRLWDELGFGTQIAEKMLRGFVFFERSERNFMKHRDFDAFKEEDPDLVKEETLLRLEETYFQRSGAAVKEQDRALHPIHTFFEGIRVALKQRAAAIQLARPVYLENLEAFAEAAYRRPLTELETQKLRTFYGELCDQPQYGVEQAVRASIVRILVSPHFCYRIDPPPSGKTTQPLSDLALASRLSYFLWSSAPDAELLAVAKAGKLQDDDTLRAQTQRMLKDPKISGLALEFFGQWFRYRDFLEQAAVSREAFPTFDDALRQAMFEEPTRLAAHLIARDQPVTDLLNSDITFVNKRLAQHYNLPFTASDGGWQEVSGLHQQGRSGVLGMAVFLTKNSQPQRTSPVKRGFWVVHHLLGEHIPPPPPGVVALPAKETDTNGQTIRQLLAAHVDDEKCARCHQRFDQVGLAMEGFDAIGRTRSKDFAGRPIDNLVELPTGAKAQGIADFAKYLAAERADEFTQTLCRKLLGYALGRSLQLSDQPLLDTMQGKLESNEYRFTVLFETIVTSPQFRNQRCRDFTTTAFRHQLSGN